MKRAGPHSVTKRYKTKVPPSTDESSPAESKEITRQSILFLCTYNSVRSQIAEGLMRAWYPDRFDVYSAGIAPAGVHPLAIRTMQEVGVDITAQKSKSVREFRDQEFDYLIRLSHEVRNALGTNTPRARVYVDLPVRSPSDIYEDEDAALTDFRDVREQLQAILEELFGQGQLSHVQISPARKSQPSTRSRDNKTGELAG